MKAHRCETFCRRIARYEKTAWAGHNTFFHNNHYTKHVDQKKLWLLDVYNLQQWRSVGDLTTHAIFGLRLDDVIVLS